MSAETVILRGVADILVSFLSIYRTTYSLLLCSNKTSTKLDVFDNPDESLAEYF